MSGVNKVFLLGNLGADVTVRHLSDGRQVSNVNIATTEVWRDQSGNKQKHTEWHRLNFFGRQAEIASQYMRKGSMLFVEGQLRTRSWTDKDDQQKQSTEVRVLQFQIINYRRDDQESGRRSQGESEAGSVSGDKSSQPRKSGQSGDNSGDNFDNADEDIPW